MKYIERYILKICPTAVVMKSKTTESVYYELADGFTIRLSEHIGWYAKDKVSIVKAFNTSDFIVILGSSPFPLIKSRKEVKEMIKALYENHVITSLAHKFHEEKKKSELESIDDWGTFWCKACEQTANARYLGTELKNIIKEYFNDGLHGEKMINEIRNIKPTTDASCVKKRFKKIMEKLVGS